MNSKITSGLFLATALSLGLTPNHTDAKGGRGGVSLGRIFRSSPAPKNPHLSTVPQNTSSSVRRVLDTVVPRDNFMRYFLAARAGIAGAQYIALTPANLDLIAGAQYRAMLDNANVLPKNHPTNLRVKKSQIGLYNKCSLIRGSQKKYKNVCIGR